MSTFRLSGSMHDPAQDRGADPRAAIPPCTNCGTQPGTIRDSPILGQRDLCPSCHRTALLTLLHPRPVPLTVSRTGLQCPDHPGAPTVLANPAQYPHLHALGYSPDEVAAAGILVRCRVPGCRWWNWEGLVVDPALVRTPNP